MRNENVNEIQNQQSCQNAVMVSAEFENFKDDFLSSFVFKQIERLDFNRFLIIHFKVYNIVYKSIYTVQEYAKIAIKEDFNDFEIYGMELKPLT